MVYAYHVEVEPDIVANWGEVPAYRCAVIDTLGELAMTEMLAEADQEMAGFLDCANSISQLYECHC